MKLLMTTDAVGGVWTYALDLCSALAAHDVEVVLASMGPRPTDTQRDAANALSNVRLIESDYRLEWMTEPWDDVAAAGAWLLDLAAATSVDVVHLNGYSHAALPWKRPVVCIAHSCVSTWWQAVHGAPPPKPWDEYRRRVIQGLNSADVVVAPTAAFLDQLGASYALTRPTRVVRNGRVPTPFDCELPRHPIVLACGRPWDVSKNMSVLDEASRGAPWRAYVIGSSTGPEGQEFISSSLRAVGVQPVHQVHAWMRQASIFVHPALYEPFGLAVLEAATAGCALVLADIPPLRELWNGAAEFFQPRSSRELRATLQTLFAAPERQRELAAAARARADEYSMTAAAAEYFDIYRSLFRGRANRRRAVA